MFLSKLSKITPIIVLLFGFSGFSKGLCERKLLHPAVLAMLRDSNGGELTPTELLNILGPLFENGRIDGHFEGGGLASLQIERSFGSAGVYSSRFDFLSWSILDNTPHATGYFFGPKYRNDRYDFGIGLNPSSDWLQPPLELSTARWNESTQTLKIKSFVTLKRRLRATEKLDRELSVHFAPDASVDTVEIKTPSAQAKITIAPDAPTDFHGKAFFSGGDPYRSVFAPELPGFGAIVYAASAYDLQNNPDHETFADIESFDVQHNTRFAHLRRNAAGKPTELIVGVTNFTENFWLPALKAFLNNPLSFASKSVRWNDRLAIFKIPFDKLQLGTDQAALFEYSDSSLLVHPDVTKVSRGYEGSWHIFNLVFERSDWVDYRVPNHLYLRYGQATRVDDAPVRARISADFESILANFNAVRNPPTEATRGTN